MDNVRVLLLMRHAKSSWADPALADRERPLSARGEEASRRMAVFVEATGVRPEVVLCSPARRTRDTLELLRPALGEGAEVVFDEALYGAEATAILGRLRTLDDSVGSAMVLGHNPGLQDLALDLIGSGDADACSQLQAKFPTAALATLELGDFGWSDLGPGRARLARLTLPRQL